MIDVINILRILMYVCMCVRVCVNFHLIESFYVYV